MTVNMNELPSDAVQAIHSFVMACDVVAHNGFTNVPSREIRKSNGSARESLSRRNARASGGRNVSTNSERIYI